MDTKERNKEIKTRLEKVFGRNVSVKGGRGTAHGWVDITIKVDDPCPFKQNEAPCSTYCEATGVCKGNDRAIIGGYGNTARQLLRKDIEEKVKEAVKGIEFYHFYVDDGYGTERECYNFSVDFI